MYSRPFSQKNRIFLREGAAVHRPYLSRVNRQSVVFSSPTPAWLSIFPPSLQVFRLTAGTFLNYGKIWAILQSTYLDPGVFCSAKKERVRSKVFLSCYRTSLGLGFRIRRTYKYAFIAKNLHLLRGRASTAQQGRGWLKRSWIPDSRYWMPDFFRQSFSGTWIPDSSR